MKIELTKEQAVLYSELKQLAKLANQRILRLERNFGKKTLAVQKLEEKLSNSLINAWGGKGRVRVSKKFSEIQMKAVIKELQKFRNNLFTTKSGIKKAKKKTISSLQIQFGTEEKDISVEEAEALASFFDDKEVNKITNFIEGSDILSIIEGAIARSDSYEVFRNQALSIIKYNKGKNIENLLKKTYLKYVNRSKGSKIEIVNNYIMDLINNASFLSDLRDVESIIESYKKDGRLTAREFNYLIEKLREKENEIIQGI